MWKNILERTNYLCHCIDIIIVHTRNWIIYYKENAIIVRIVLYKQMGRCKIIAKGNDIFFAITQNMWSIVFEIMFLKYN